MLPDVISDWINRLYCSSTIFSQCTQGTHSKYNIQNDSSQSWYTLIGAKEWMEHSFLRMCSIVSYARCPHVFTVRCTFLTSGYSTMQFVETDTIQTIYLPSIVIQASLSLAHVAFSRIQTLVHWRKREGMKMVYTGCTLTIRGICYVSRGKSAIFPVYFPF